MRSPCIALLFTLLALAPSVCHGQRTLRFVKHIGEGWARDVGSAWMSFVTFSPDGKTIASDAAASPQDTSGGLTLWSFPQGRLLKQLAVRPTGVSPDFRYYASYQGIGEIATGKALISVPAGSRANYVFSPDSRYVAEGGAQKGVRVLALPSGRQVSSFGRLSPSSMAFSPDGKTLASGHWKVVKLWDLRTGQRLAVLRGFRRYVEALSFSKDGKMLATAGGGQLQIWNLRHRRPMKKVEVDADSTPTFSPDGRLIAMGGYGSGTVWLINTKNGRLVDHSKVSDLGCGSTAFSSDGRYLITPSTGGLITWPYDRGGTIRVFRVRKR